MTTLFRKKAERERGQVMVLGAIALLVMALSVMITLNVERAVHQRITLQNASDAQAYSYAVQEARVFNYMAFANRSIAAAYVAMATMHAYVTEVGFTVD